MFMVWMSREVQITQREDVTLRWVVGSFQPQLGVISMDHDVMQATATPSIS
jgi:hypothetical protein